MSGNGQVSQKIILLLIFYFIILYSFSLLLFISQSFY